MSEFSIVSRPNASMYAWKKGIFHGSRNDSCVYGKQNTFLCGTCPYLTSVVSTQVNVNGSHEMPRQTIPQMTILTSTSSQLEHGMKERKLFPEWIACRAIKMSSCK